ncbi:MAG: hypothetical protein D6B27_05340 [Gammaproteobacteria bacterium]|nr:MAG: hypothetical protein D6B27_05340 [Gammaproteobacteria bacterium]
MKKLFSAVLFLVACSNVAAQGLKYEFGLGYGWAYGGLIGGQFAFVNDYHRIRTSLGAFGHSVGYDYKPFKNVSVGLSYGSFVYFSAYEDYRGIRLSYLPTGDFRKGVEIAIEAGTADYSTVWDDVVGAFFGIDEDDEDFQSLDEKNKPVVNLSIGYSF